MNKIVFIFLFLFCFSFSNATEKLFENPIDLKIYEGCQLNEFCKKYIENIDVEKYIKRELDLDFVVISLDECLDIALKNNFDIQIAKHDYLSYKYEYNYNLSKMFFDFNTTSYISDYRGQILVGGVLRDMFHETAVSINLTAQHNLTRGGEDIFQAKAAKFFAKSKNHKLNYTQSEVMFYTCKYYYQLLLAKINIEIFLRNLIERNAQLTLTKSQQKSGFGTKFDVVRSMNESALAKTNLINSLIDFRISQTKLANILGIDVDTPLMPFESDIKQLNLVEDVSDVDKLFVDALNYREDLKAYNDLIHYEKEVKNIYITNFIPKPMVNFQQQFQGTFNTSIRPNYILGAYVTWQPGQFLSFGTISKIKEQKEKIKQRIFEYENKKRSIYEALLNACSVSKFNSKQIELNRNRVDYTNESVKLAMLRFNNGKGILLDVIQAQTETTLARVQYVSSIISYNLAQLEIVFNTGLIDKNLILQKYNP